ncbi:hypothetical protein JWG39_03795 [Desulforhopalus vacuolatus]|uniref:hypothetical protein n=1 Tax=Desulforhopalus vacuolatus TaxID=40414 RepID=UPI0019641FFF|nr:hypothetical protein [Desulforhopalus vacuolatus]MBM9518937.1 hypothetical protein [Desulforhopalus vacuolatus]
MELLNTLLDYIFYRGIQPLILCVRDLFTFIFLDTMSLAGIPYSGQVVIIAVSTVLFAFLLRKWLDVETKEKIFQKKFAAQKAERDNITVIPDKNNRDAMFTSADQSIDEDFNIYLAQHYFRYVLIYLLPIFLVMAWLNSTLDEKVLPVVSEHPYLFLLPSKPFGMEGVSVTLLFLFSYLVSLIAGFQLKKRYFSHKHESES